MLAFPGAILGHKIAATSDHVPIHLRLHDSTCRRVPRPFKYELCWEREPSLSTVIETGWAQTPGETVDELRQKMHALSGNLTTWDRTQFGNVRKEIAKLRKELQAMREIQGRSGPCREETKILDRLVELYHREEILWRRRARLEWLMHGDKNTYFFHLRASRQQRKNQIKALQRPDGQLTEDKREMEEFTTDF